MTATGGHGFHFESSMNWPCGLINIHLVIAFDSRENGKDRNIQKLFKEKFRGRGLKECVL